MNKRKFFVISFPLFFVVFIQIGVAVSPPYARTLIDQLANLPEEPRDDACSGSCIKDGTDCQVKDDSCYIEGNCYKGNQTRLNVTNSCLQCQPDTAQTTWNFNPSCNAGDQCVNVSLARLNVCPFAVILAFYNDSREAITKYYNYEACSNNRDQCQSGFFRSTIDSKIYACCPGFFCPDGQVCMIPCRDGAYCPSPLSASNGTCRSAVRCPENIITEYGSFGCGGSTVEGYCPTGSYCSTPGLIAPCPNGTKYCPTGVNAPLDCPSGYVCAEGRARRTRVITSVLISVIAILFVYVGIAQLAQWLLLTKKKFGQHELRDENNVSDYFKKPTADGHGRRREYKELHIHLERAKLRNVTRFDATQNRGFTGRITAGKLTALMGGSGCGKSSLLETIHGRRQLREGGGSITFAEHEPLSNLLTDYVGYVPQADIMHNDLTVFETVYYSARARRLDDSQQQIIDDVCFVLKKIGLSHMHNSFTRTLSGGQRKRVNVAMEVAACPKVLLLDEPTSGLDTVSCDDLFELLQLIKFSAAGPVTIIMVIHQPSYELFEKIDEIFFLTPLCCLAYQGPRDKARDFLTQKIFAKVHEYPPARQNESDTCFIMLTKAQQHVDNHDTPHQRTTQPLEIRSLRKRAWFPFYYVFIRSLKQIYLRGAFAEAAYLFAYFLLGTCVGYLFENKQQLTCDIKSLPTIYFLISLSFGILTCISSQRLFGVEIIDSTYERESRNYFHPFQYWLAKTLVDLVRMLFYPLLFLSMLYIEVVPRGPFSYYYGVMILLSFICSAIGQLTSVVFNRTEYAYLGGTIIALLSCLLSGFSPTKAELNRGSFILTFSFSRHTQHLLFRHETDLYLQGLNLTDHIWGPSVGVFRAIYDYQQSEIPIFWLLFWGFVLRALTFFFLYAKSEYRSKTRFRISNAIPSLTGLLTCQSCRTRSSASNSFDLAAVDPRQPITNPSYGVVDADAF